MNIYDRKILLVDDNRELLMMIRDTLRRNGYTRIVTAENVKEAVECFGKEEPDMAILDIMLPDGDGFTLFRELNAGGEVPVLFLSARDADADRLFGLGLGADDYLTKPFLTQELLLRVQLILRRAYRAQLQQGAAARLRVGDRVVDLNDATVTRPDGAVLTLTATERGLLQKLAANRGHIVTFDALCQAVWNADYYG